MLKFHATDVDLRPDPSRVILTFFVAGQEVVGGAVSRASQVIDRVLALPEEVVVERLRDILDRFNERHGDLSAQWERHADRVAGHLGSLHRMSHERRLLLGATFTAEYAIEAAAVCNPSVVRHPDRGSSDASVTPIVMSYRAIGEGHRSSIGFHTGSVSSEGVVTLAAPAGPAALGHVVRGLFDQQVFWARLVALNQAHESATYVLDALPARFSFDELVVRLDILRQESDTRWDALDVAATIMSIAECCYEVHFDATTEISQRILEPVMAAERGGVEDARFVEFIDDDGEVTYLATYTAFDGVRIAQQLIQTKDFTTFAMSPIVGDAAERKGLALFPRRIDGNYVALSRYDRETNSVVRSSTLGHWGPSEPYQLPSLDWDVIQLGNCGSPLETPWGWLVITHGVGPMRTYSLGAVLLDLEDPQHVIGTLTAPLLSPTREEQNGYVPNVVYSCGALLIGDLVVLPYGVGDARIKVATFSLGELMNNMEFTGPTRSPLP